MVIKGDEGFTADEAVLIRNAEDDTLFNSGVILKPLTVVEMDAVARREIETLGRTIRENGITLE